MKEISSVASMPEILLGCGLLSTLFSSLNSASRVDSIARHILDSPPVNDSGINSRVAKKRKRKAGLETETVVAATGFSEWRISENSLTAHNEFSDDATNYDDDYIEHEDISQVDENVSIIDADRDTDEASVEGNADNDTGATPRAIVLKEDEIWKWQYEKEAEIYSSKTTSNNETTLTQYSHEDIAFKVAKMWEPNREWYGAPSWWTWDQYETLASERPRKLIRIGALSGTSDMLGLSQELENHEYTHSIDNDSSSSLVVDLSSVGIGQIDDSAMQVPRDIIYDESELTPEEVAVQRWSIEYRKTRLTELQNLKNESVKLQRDQLERQKVDLANLYATQTYVYKIHNYPILYGGNEYIVDRIIELEARLQERFEASGGIGYVEHLVVKGEENESWNLVSKPTIVSSALMRARNENLEEGEEIEDGEMEEGEELDVNRDPGNKERVMWPVLPIRDLI